MALFPAYDQGDKLDISDEELLEGNDKGVMLSPAAESALLAEPAWPPARPAPAPTPPADFFLDCKLERAFLRVSTLYYPARPEYRPHSMPLGVSRGKKVCKERVRRYWRRGGEPGAGEGGEEVGEHAAALRARLREQPQDEDLWLRYIDFLEWAGPAGGGEAAAAAALRGARCLPGAPALRARTHAALRRSLDAADLAEQLQQLRSEERCGQRRAELWARELSARACAGGCAGGGGGPAGGGAAAVAAAALRDRSVAPHAHVILHTYGAILRSGGHDERLTQLLELLCAMNLPALGGFPPPREAGAERGAEAQLAAWEGGERARAGAGGARWARVERARAALHWRPAFQPHPIQIAADPERAPPAAAAAELLLPARDSFRLLLTVLRLAGTPLLPVSEYAARAHQGAAREAAADWELAGGAGAAGLLRAARRLPPAHPAAAPAPAAARSLLARTPYRPASHNDNTGYSEWVSALWAGALAAETGARRGALLGWRLRELHARLLLLDHDDEEGAKQIRRAARALLQGAAAGAAGGAAAAALWARAEGGARGGAAAARAAARAAADPAEPHTHALYAGRVAWEMCAARGAEEEGLQLLAAAVLRRPGAAGGAAAAALEECEKQCALLEQQFATAEAAAEEEGGEGEEGGAEGALLPGAGEWGAARALLAGPARRRRLEAELLRQGRGRGAGCARYREQAACALSAAAAREHAAAATARRLRHLAPLNAYLALLSSDTRAWEASGGSGAETELGAVCGLLGALLQAGGGGGGAARAERGLRRALRGAGGAAGGALLHALRLQAGAAAGADTAAILTAALHHAPHYKWAVERGAALGALGAHAAAELLLERGLRLRALPQELQPDTDTHTDPTT